MNSQVDLYEPFIRVRMVRDSDAGNRAHLHSSAINACRQSLQMTLLWTAPIALDVLKQPVYAAGDKLEIFRCISSREVNAKQSYRPQTAASEVGGPFTMQLLYSIHLTINRTQAPPPHTHTHDCSCVMNSARCVCS